MGNQLLKQENYFQRLAVWIDKGLPERAKNEEPDVIFEPDEDFYRSITMEEVRERLHKVIDKLYASK
jgi:hypothetical protein